MALVLIFIPVAGLGASITYIFINNFATSLGLEPLLHGMVGAISDNANRPFIWEQ